MDTHTETTIRKKYELLDSIFDERTRRLWAAAESQALDFSGVSVVSRATGLSRTTIYQGIKDLAELRKSSTIDKNKRIRAAGGGRKPIKEQDATLLRDLEQLVAPLTRGDP